MLGRLRQIAAEERVHERLLAGLLLQLPREAPSAHGLSCAANFFRGLASRDAGIHFTRIGALDSAVCVLLSALRKAQPALYHPALVRIAHDEARHVIIANHYAHRLTTSAARTAAAAETRAGLVALLATHAHNLEALGIDPALLLRRLAIPPRFLRS